MSNALKLNLVDVEYIRHHTDVVFHNHHGGLIPSPPSASSHSKKKESPKKKKATFKKKANGKKGGGKKGRGKNDGEVSGKVMQQKKNMYANYIKACTTLKCIPSHHICNLFSLQESVDWTKEEREQMNQPVTKLALEEKIGPAGTRALFFRFEIIVFGYRIF